MKKFILSLFACSLIGLPLLRSTEEVHSEHIEELCAAAQELANEFPEAQALELKQDIALLAQELNEQEEQGGQGIGGTWRDALASFVTRLQQKVGAGRLSRGPVEHLVNTLDSWMRFGIAASASAVAIRNVPPKSVLAVLFAVLEQEPLTDAIRDADEFAKKRSSEEMAMFNQCIKSLVGASVFAGTRIGLWFFI